MTNNQCPNCGNQEFETVKHSWREGVTPYPDTYVCWNCDHEWTDKELENNHEPQPKLAIPPLERPDTHQD